MGDTMIDERGRVVIPNELRELLNLRPDQKLKVTAKGRDLVLSPAVEEDEFIAELKGCVRGSKVSPEALKDIWGAQHPHD